MKGIIDLTIWQVLLSYVFVIVIMTRQPVVWYAAES